MERQFHSQGKMSFPRERIQGALDNSLKWKNHIYSYFLDTNLEVIVKYYLDRTKVIISNLSLNLSMIKCMKVCVCVFNILILKAIIF